MPKKDMNGILSDNSPVLDDNTGILTENQNSSALGLLRRVLSATGYDKDLEHFRSGTWFENACNAGIIRDADGKSIHFDEKNPLSADDREKAAKNILLSNSNFYVAKRDEPGFVKLSYDPVSENLRSKEYATPGKINRPWLIQMFLAYCGFHIEAVEQYKKQKAQVADNPLYNTLHSDTAKDTALNFTRAALAHDITKDPKEYTQEDLNSVRFKAKINCTNLKKKLENGIALSKNELEDLFVNRLRRNFNSPENVKELDENPGIEKSMRNAFSNREEVKKLTDEKIPENIRAAAQKDYLDKLMDITAVKLWNVYSSDKNKLPLPQNNHSQIEKNEAVKEEVKEEIQEEIIEVKEPENEIKQEEEKIKDEIKEPDIEKVVDEIQEPNQEKNEEKIENSEEIYDPEQEVPDEQIENIENIQEPEKTDEEIIVEDIQEPEKIDDEIKEENEPEKMADEDIPDYILFKLTELEHKRRLYEKDTPAEMVISSAMKALRDVAEKGLPDADNENFIEQNQALNNAVCKLVMVNRVENAIKSGDKNTVQLMTTPDKAGLVAENLEKTGSVNAVTTKLGDNPAGKFQDILNNEKELDRFSASVMREIRDNPAGNLIPEGSIIHGAVYKQPGVKGWQRMPGKTEEEVKASLEELDNMSGDSRMFKNIAAADSQINKKLAAEKRAEDSKKLDERIEEMTNLTKRFNKGSVMQILGQNAVDALKRLRETGLPDNPDSPTFEIKQKALKNAVASVAAYQKAGSYRLTYRLDSQLPENKAAEVEKYTKAYKDNAMLDKLVAADNQGITDKLLNKEIRKNGVMCSIIEEKKQRERNAIPDTAERKGVLWRMGPNERWRQMPGASMKEINDSYLTVCDEKYADLLASRQKSLDNIHLSDSSKINNPVVNK